jgi:hypothetical protein
VEHYVFASDFSWENDGVFVAYASEGQQSFVPFPLFAQEIID